MARLASGRLIEVSLSMISTVANNLNGHPSVFRRMKPKERMLIKKITGEYPTGWNPKRRRFTKAHKSKVSNGSRKVGMPSGASPDAPLAFQLSKP